MNGSLDSRAGERLPRAVVTYECWDGFVELVGAAEDARWREGHVEIFASGSWWRIGAEPSPLGIAYTRLVEPSVSSTEGTTP